RGRAGVGGRGCISGGRVLQPFSNTHTYSDSMCAHNKLRTPCSIMYALLKGGTRIQRVCACMCMCVCVCVCVRFLDCGFFLQSSSSSLVGRKRRGMTKGGREGDDNRA